MTFIIQMGSIVANVLCEVMLGLIETNSINLRPLSQERIKTRACSRGPCLKIFHVSFNPLLHFQNDKLAPKTFGFQHQGDPNFAGGFGGTPRGPPDAENRRFSELTCDSENEVKG